MSIQTVMTEERIEHRVEVAIDRLDRHFLTNQITREQYDRDVLAISKWADEQYALLRNC